MIPVRVIGGVLYPTSKQINIGAPVGADAILYMCRRRVLWFHSLLTEPHAVRLLANATRSCVKIVKGSVTTSEFLFKVVTNQLAFTSLKQVIEYLMPPNFPFC
ncbi:hypothetical protein TRVL_01003 [Trypanosoma vivax]|uniref:Uncharacterized protein n=1 Tax=Trypanosoma vivax (strain Y486) TaxID=1055687 RepID=G0U1I2_TRYVY|nr:hypothetical protein TRVL_01003 [Trypanosoma vivax]CCC49939.1 hypothetical protein TVY486_0805460 [Trypanosoma vivax Y486]